MRRLLVVGLVVLAGCGDDQSAGRERERLTVFAASSLRAAMTDYANQFPEADVRFSFGGSDKLAAQLRQGVPADVFASADSRTPEALQAEGILDTPVAFAANRLVLAVPEGSSLRSLDDAAARGVKLGIGAEGVPIGRFAREYLGTLGEKGRAVLANVRTEEPDVASITAKVRQGAVDGGIVYYTEVAASKGALEPVELPGAKPTVLAAGVVRESRNRAAAAAFVEGLSQGNGREALRRAGFEQP